MAEIAKPEFKARMAVKLAVAGAFHTDFMKPAVPALEAVLKEVTIVKPRIPVISNVDAKTHSDPDVIKQILAKQACPCACACACDVHVHVHVYVYGMRMACARHVHTRHARAMHAPP